MPVHFKLLPDNWTGQPASDRFAILLSGLLLLMTAAGFGVQTPFWTLYALGICLAAFGALWFSLTRIMLSNADQLPRQQLLLNALMMALVLCAGLLSGAAVFAMALFLPAIHGALRMDRRGAWGVVAGCVVVWVILRSLGAASGEQPVLPALIETLPLLLTVMLVQQLVAVVAHARERTSTLSRRDELTGLMNMRAFTRLVQTEQGDAAASGRKYALLMVDIDGLQRFNDDFGHEQGDRVIAAVADALNRSVRSSDWVARYGGDEFVVYLPDADDARADVVCKRISQNVYNITLSFGRSAGRVNVHTGCAIYPDSGTELQPLLAFASKAMNRDKEFRRRGDAARADPESLRQQAGIKDLL